MHGLHNNDAGQNKIYGSKHGVHTPQWGNWIFKGDNSRKSFNSDFNSESEYDCMCELRHGGHI